VDRLEPAVPRDRRAETNRSFGRRVEVLEKLGVEGQANRVDIRNPRTASVIEDLRAKTGDRSLGRRIRAATRMSTRQT
jgi:hypothetical protein